MTTAAPSTAALEANAATAPEPPVVHLGKFYPPYRGGMESHLALLCREIARSMPVRAIVANETHHYAAAVIDGVTVERLPRWFTLLSAPVCPRMATALRASPAAIVHLHLPNPAACLAYLASGVHTRLVVSWHSDIVRQRIAGRLLGPLQRAILARASAVVASSSGYLASSPMLGLHRDRCRVIPYGIDPGEFGRRDGAVVALLRARYGPRVVLGVGRMVYYKGFQYLIRAMTKVRGHLLLVGDGPLRAELENEARRLGVAGRVTFTGLIDQAEIVNCYHAADVFVLPSIARSEAFGIVQLEAMACRLPVVNTWLDSGVPSVSLDGLSGITVPPCDAEALAAAVNLLLDDPALRATYGANGARRVREEFSLPVMTERMLTLYRDVMGRGLAIREQAPAGSQA